MYLQLVINPGSTSTKLAIYEDDKKIVQENISHDGNELAAYKNLIDQVPFRMEIIKDFMARNGTKAEDLSAVMGRGGLVPGLKTGGYQVNDDLYTALSGPISSPHASNMGGLLARDIAKPLGIPAYIYDAVTSGELQEVASITGIPDIKRRSFCHVLNSRAMAIKYAQSIDTEYEKLNLLVAHLGGGVSASVHEQGRIIDSLGDDDGQFSPERAGSVPGLELVRLCYSGKYTEAEMMKKVRGKGGMFAHLGTSDCLAIENMVLAGDKHAELIFKAQAYQIAKGIGLLSIVLKGKCDAIILTGGLARSKMLTDWVTEYVSYIAPVVVMPGENEMEALALGGIRLLSGQEQPNTYHLPTEEGAN